MGKVSQTQDTTRYDVSGGKDKPEILVALEHAPLVERLLERAGVYPERVDHSEALLLSRFQLQEGDVGTFAAKAPELLATDTGGLVGEREKSELRRELEEAAEEAADDEATDAATTYAAGDLLARLRFYFHRRYAGWVPTMGKNRLVALVNAGGGTVSHGGGPRPTMADAPPPRAGSAGSGVAIGILDTALWAHPAFAGRDLASADLVQRKPAYDYATGHATFVAGLVLEQAPGATLRVTSCLGPDGQATSWDVATAIVDLGRQGVDILNLSLVCYTKDRRPPLALASAVDRLDPDVLVIACAGNHGDPVLKLPEEAHRQPAWPAALDDVVAVGSAQRSTSSKGPGYELDTFTPKDAPWIDVMVRGSDVRSTYLYGVASDDPPKEEEVTFEGGALWGGTSFSAARLSGRVAAEASAKKIPVREALQGLLAPLRPARPRDGEWLPPFLDLD